MAEMIRWAERLFLVPLAALVIWRVWPQIPEHPHMVLFLASELLGVVLLLTQRRGEWSTDLYPLLLALFGTGVALLVAPGGYQIAPEWVSQAFVFSGATIALLAKIFLGRSFGLVPANRGVKHYGVYQIVRHPMYAGYMISHVGFLLLFFSPHNVVIYAMAWLVM
jgi:protein-S-isoprenylcysteine O-methyltransferase Ste14